MPDVYVVSAFRTPIGKYAGVLSGVRPDDLAAHIIRALLDKHPTLPLEDIEEVIWGAANQAGEDNRNVARMAALMAGLPVTVSGVTVNRLCASGLQAIVDGYRAIKNGDGDLYIVGGSESMSRAPFVMSKAETPFDKNVSVFDTSLGWRFTNKTLANKYYPFVMGETAENVAERYSISREEQDQFAVQSQEKYAKALEAGRWKDELVYMPVPGAKGAISMVEADEQPRLSSIEKLGTLKPAFKANGTVTAGNSSSLNDGSASLLLASEAALSRYNLKPLARIMSTGAAGVDPAVMGIGPVPASQKALKRAGIGAQDLDLIELNEAFASQSIACIRDLGLDPNKVNVNGGAIAIGHPLGCSGARISTTLIHQMGRQSVRYGLATMCIGVGQGLAVVYERV